MVSTLYIQVLDSEGKDVEVLSSNKKKEFVTAFTTSVKGSETLLSSSMFVLCTLYIFSENKCIGNG